ncbi:DUF6359 domain-containing protein [Peribacillus alkalitolerans]|uniref:DUF6359 domain-containing protein n=1 Tax=Peribacillus alkalitolerans TaxID=1550385 RepID=UPI0013CFA2EF|nr:DUF6359 domain-containing protein [Peribacillus alkalitolerans]
MNFFKRRLMALSASIVLLLTTILPHTIHTAVAAEVIGVKEAIALRSGNVSVEGFIVGHALTTGSYDFTSPFSNDFNFIFADDPAETDITKMMPVQLPASLRPSFGLQTNPTIIGKKVQVTASILDYFSVPGLKNTTAIHFSDEAGTPTEPPVTEGPKIFELQGESHISPYSGKTVAGVKGIVTHVTDSNNFFIQDQLGDQNNRTSDAIMVYKKAHGVQKGDIVFVNGTVKEWVLEGYQEKLETDLSMTEINATSVSVHLKNQPFPQPIILGKDRTIPSQIIDNDSLSSFDVEEDAIDFYESIEGMMVGLESPSVVGPQKYGEVPVIASRYADKVYTPLGAPLLAENNTNPERIHLLINKDFVAKTGDRFDGIVQGVLSYSYSNYKLLVDATKMPSLIKQEIQKDAIGFVKNDNELTIASYNVENFSSKTSEDKVEKIANSFIQELKTPDVIGLIEMQDNNGETDDGTTDATKSFEKLVNKIEELGGPLYAYTDIAPEDNHDGGAPGGNIRVGYLYNPERVSLKEATKGTADQAVGYENGGLTVNPGRIDPQNPLFEDTRKSLAAQFEFQGEDVIVITNHLNSKGGDLPLFGKIQPPNLTSEAKRIKLAKVINAFVDSIISQDPKANVVVLGDQNDFEFSPALKRLEGDILQNLLYKLPIEERYTYNYQGNAQTLDHMLVSKNLYDKTEFDILNINSPFMNIHGRASDHDPLLAQLDLTDVPEVKDCPDQASNNGKHKGHDKKLKEPNGKACGHPKAS